jgi:hypothetical protein
VANLGEEATHTSSNFLPYLTLFTSFSTLICCAIPALLVSIGMGAALAATVSAVPQLIWLSENKGLVFGVAGGLLALSVLSMRFASNRTCPIDPKLAAACQRGRKFSRITLWISCVLYVIGAFFAFLAPLLLS